MPYQLTPIIEPDLRVCRPRHISSVLHSTTQKPQRLPARLATQLTPYPQPHTLFTAIYHFLFTHTLPPPCYHNIHFPHHHFCAPLIHHEFFLHTPIPHKTILSTSNVELIIDTWLLTTQTSNHIDELFLEHQIRWTDANNFNAVNWYRYSVGACWL